MAALQSDQYVDDSLYIDISSIHYQGIIHICLIHTYVLNVYIHVHMYIRKGLRPSRPKGPRELWFLI